MMDLTKFNLEDVILTAMKSEIEAKGTYNKLADRIENAFMKERMRFLAEEEEKHRSYLEKIYKERFGGKPIKLPEKSVVPMPEVVLTGPDQPITSIFEDAMEAEKRASDYYLAMVELFQVPEIKLTLTYFGKMEMGHYDILKNERESFAQMENVDSFEPMMHIGP